MWKFPDKGPGEIDIGLLRKLKTFFQKNHLAFDYL